MEGRLGRFVRGNKGKLFAAGLAAAACGPIAPAPTPEPKAHVERAQSPEEATVRGFVEAARDGDRLKMLLFIGLNDKNDPFVPAFFQTAIHFFRHCNPQTMTVWRNSLSQDGPARVDMFAEFRPACIPDARGTYDYDSARLTLDMSSPTPTIALVPIGVTIGSQLPRPQ